MHAKGKDKGRLSREEEDEIFCLLLVEVEQGKVEGADVEEEEEQTRECHRGGIKLRMGQI